MRDDKSIRGRRVCPTYSAVGVEIVRVHGRRLRALEMARDGVVDLSLDKDGLVHGGSCGSLVGVACFGFRCQGRGAVAAV